MEAATEVRPTQTADCSSFSKALFLGESTRDWRFRGPSPIPPSRTGSAP
jgi:hypothetical protein